MMPAGSPFFCLRLSGFLSNWKLTGSTSGFKASKIFEKQHRNRIQPDYLSQSTSKFETGLKGSDIFLSAFISQKWKIYNLWKSFIFCLTTPTLRCKLGLIKIDEQKSNHESGRKRANEGGRFAAKAWWSASGRWNSEQNRNSRVSALRIEGVGINCQQLEWYRDQSFLEC